MKYGITLHLKQMTKVNKLTLLHLYASVAIGLNHVATGTHQIFLSICRLLILIFFRELRDQQVSASFINSDLIWTYLQLISAHFKQSEREINNNVILNITLTVRITLYNKATFVALIAQIQLYVFFKLSQNLNVPGRFFVTFWDMCFHWKDNKSWIYFYCIASVSPFFSLQHQNVTYVPCRFLLQFDTKVLRYESIFIIIIFKIVLNSLILWGLVSIPRYYILVSYRSQNYGIGPSQLVTSYFLAGDI